jgi:hypothetical protein
MKEFSIIGTISNLTDNTDPENPIFTAIEGYHVNVLPEDMTTELEPYVITVSSTPRQVFGGRNDTVFLKFASEQEFKDITGYGTDESTDI